MMHRGWVTTARFLRYCASHHALHLQPLGSTPLIQYSAKPFCSSSDEASGDRVRTASNAGRGEQRQPSGADLENVFEQSPVDQDKAAKAWLSAKKVYTDASTLFRCLSECSLRPRTVVRMLQVIHNQRPAYFEPLSNNELLRACRLTAFRTHFAREAAAYHVLKKLFFTLLERDLAPESAEEFLSTLIHLGDFAASINASQIVREKFPFGLYRKVLERNKAFLIEQIATLDAPTLVRVLGCCWELGFIDHGVCSVGFPLLNQLNFNDLDSQTTEQLIALSVSQPGLLFSAALFYTAPYQLLPPSVAAASPGPQGRSHTREHPEPSTHSGTCAAPRWRLSRTAVQTRIAAARA